MVEALDRVAPVEEPEASQAIAKVFSDDGISVHTSVRITALRREGIGIAATVAAGAGVFEVRASGPLAATGRRPVTVGLGLDEASSSPWTTTSSICTRRGGLRLNLGCDDALLCCPLEGRGGRDHGYLLGGLVHLPFMAAGERLRGNDDPARGLMSRGRMPLGR
jgi:hypothetical protein